MSRALQARPPRAAVEPSRARKRGRPTKSEQRRRNPTPADVKHQEREAREVQEDAQRIGLVSEEGLPHGIHGSKDPSA